MKKRLLTLFLVPAWLSACRSTPTEITLPLEFSFEQAADSIPVRLGTTARVDWLLIRVDEVTDSRCSVEYSYCVWEGDAVVHLTVGLACRLAEPACEAPETHLELHTSSRFETSGEAAGARITLVALSPPASGGQIPRNQYVAWLRARPLGS